MKCAIRGFCCVVPFSFERRLPEGEFKGAVSGYLYIPFKGKTASIQSLELIYDGTVLKLR
jgi:hypothetical protein